jgi:hypothetical protein
MSALPKAEIVDADRTMIWIYTPSFMHARDLAQSKFGLEVKVTPRKDEKPPREAYAEGRVLKIVTVGHHAGRVSTREYLVKRVRLVKKKR